MSQEPDVLLIYLFSTAKTHTSNMTPADDDEDQEGEDNLERADANVGIIPGQGDTYLNNGKLWIK